MIKIETSSFIPIYEQIKKEIKSRISLGILKRDEPLPSIRDLAADLIINPNTVARAYRELELEGFIYTRRGKGCFVADDSSALIQGERANIINQIFDSAIEEARRFNLSPEEIARVFDERLRRARENQDRGESHE
jgi:GntR family transcriptional regulator